MKTRRLLLILTVASVIAVSSLPAAAQPAKSKPGTGKLGQAFTAAFNKGDAKAAAGLWTVEGNLFDLAGQEHKGRADIEKHFEAAFAERKGAKLTIIITSAKLLTPEVVLENGIIEVLVPDGPPAVAQFSAVLVKKSGEWYFETVRQLEAQAPTHARHFEDLEWLIGQWTGENAKGETISVGYEFAENGNFIVCSFATSLKGVPVMGGTQWLAWDPIDKQIRSWTFYSGGGFGEAAWTKEDGKWSAHTKAKTTDGKKVSVTNILTRVDASNSTWQATNLTVDGKEMPDSPLVKLKRSTMTTK